MKLHLGENIKTKRKLLGLTQEQLAERLGVTFRSVSRWENGTTYPDMEILPELAKVFDTTVDSLLGYGEREEKKPCEDVLRELQDALESESIDEIKRLMRELRWEYREEFRNGFEMHMLPLFITKYTRVLRTPDVLQELRAFAEDYLENGTEMILRTQLIMRMAELEDEEHIDGFIQKYSTDDLDISRKGLLVNRYRSLEMWDKYREYHMYADYERLRLFLEGGNAETEPADPSHLCRISEAKLGMLRALNQTEPDERYPISEDGEVDIWCGMRYFIALKYAAQLSGCGEYERALTMLEDMRGMIDKLIAMPNGTVVPCRSPQFYGIGLVKNTFAGIEVFETPHEEGEYPYKNVRIMSMISLGNVPYLSLTNSVSESADSRWFDPIRGNPRFREIMRWAEQFRIILTF